MPVGLQEAFTAITRIPVVLKVPSSGLKKNVVFDPQEELKLKMIIRP